MNGVYVKPASLTGITWTDRISQRHPRRIFTEKYDITRIFHVTQFNRRLYGSIVEYIIGRDCTLDYDTASHPAVDPMGVTLADPISPSYACERGWFDIYPVHNLQVGPSYFNPWGFNSQSGISNFAFTDGHVSAYEFTVDKYSTYLLADDPLPPDITLDPNRSQE